MCGLYFNYFDPVFYPVVLLRLSYHWRKQKKIIIFYENYWEVNIYIKVDWYGLKKYKYTINTKDIIQKFLIESNSSIEQRLKNSNKILSENRTVTFSSEFSENNSLKYETLSDQTIRTA